MWRYAANKTNEEFDVVVTIPDGLLIQIEHLPVDTGKETLGVFTCPSGKSAPQIESLQKKTQEWIDRFKEGLLRWRDFWFLMEHQLWPKVGCGICSLAAPWKDLNGCVRKM